MSDRNEKLFDILLGEALDRYAEEIAGEEVTCDMTEEEIAGMERQKQRVYGNVKKSIKAQRRPHGKRLVRRIAVIAAAACILCAAAMNVSAFRTYVYKTYMEVKGTVLHVDARKISDSDYDVLAEFKYPDEIIVPGWLPNEMYIDDINGEDVLYWVSYDDGTGRGFSINAITLPVESDGGIETENNTVRIEDCTVLGMPGKLVYARSEIGNETYSVYWCSDNVKYELQAWSSRIELDTVIQNLKYLKK